MLLQLRDFLLTLLAQAPLLVRLGDGNGAGALGGGSAAAPCVLRRVQSFPGGCRRLSARASLHLQHKERLWLMFIFLVTDSRTHLQRLRVPNSVHPVDQSEHRSPVRAPVTGLLTRGLVRRDTYSGQTVVMVSSFSIVRKRAHYPGSRSHLQRDVLVKHAGQKKAAEP